MLEWSRSQNKIKSLKARGELKSVSHEKANLLGLPGLIETPLDTVKVSQKFQAILKSRNIPCYLFVTKVLESCMTDWHRLIMNPMPELLLFDLTFRLT
jgi:hypothetical protein